jgi:hypothetical protein
LAHTFASPCLDHEPKARVATNMNMMPLKVIEKEVYLWVKSPFGLLKDHGPNRGLNI